MANAELHVSLNLGPMIAALEIIQKHAAAALDEIQALDADSAPAVELPAAGSGEVDG